MILDAGSLRLLCIGSVSTANGSSMVRLGQTLVLAGIKVVCLDIDLIASALR